MLVLEGAEKWLQICRKWMIYRVSKRILLFALGLAKMCRQFKLERPETAIDRLHLRTWDTCRTVAQSLSKYKYL
jgi:hypothetical protein